MRELAITSPVVWVTSSIFAKDAQMIEIKVIMPAAMIKSDSTLLASEISLTTI